MGRTYFEERLGGERVCEGEEEDVWVHLFPEIQCYAIRVFVSSHSTNLEEDEP